ncbi:2-keto-4-pentenoate hydratase/2-oxohepta-3-ene-1,7-dioic acid hydratase in catechol pathway [Paraburkholderia sp. GAS199]|uniref:fumarylacetoacetate hydrolase family protein n=1 Tax=Paraburkholderia sp. GAS199 TaxID=3035126 RepID=UPI003D1D86E4
MSISEAQRGPELVTAYKIPNGAIGLHIQTRMNGMMVHEMSINEFAFNIATAVSLVSDAMPLEPGDLLAMGHSCRFGTFRDPARAPRQVTSSKSKLKTLASSEP